MQCALGTTRCALRCLRRARARAARCFSHRGLRRERDPPETIDRTAVLRLRPHVRLQFDERHRQRVMQVPEPVLMPDEIAVRVLKLCDGQTHVEAMTETLAGEYRAPRDVIEGDVLEMLPDLAEEGIVAHARD
jgi:pyrroloquinoline quinone biosynthesis protein D